MPTELQDFEKLRSLLHSLFFLNAKLLSIQYELNEVLCKLIIDLPYPENLTYHYNPPKNGADHNDDSPDTPETKRTGNTSGP